MANLIPVLGFKHIIVPQNYNCVINLIPNGVSGEHVDVKHVDNKEVDASGRAEAKRVKHRLSERANHKTLVELIKQLSEMIGVNGNHETQCHVLTRAARYALFVRSVVDKYSNVANVGNDGDRTSLVRDLRKLYTEAREKIASMTDSSDNGETRVVAPSVKRERDVSPMAEPKRDDVSVGVVDERQTVIMSAKQYYSSECAKPSTTTPDHCLPLKKRAKMIMYSDF